MTDFANVAAATAAGYKLTDTDRGASFVPANQRFHAHLTKYVTGGTHQSGFELRAEGFSATSAASARAAANTVLNNQRSHRYGFGSATGNDTLGVALTRDAK